MPERTARYSISPARKKFLREADNGEVFESLPYSDFYKWIREKSLYMKILSIPAFIRTARVKTIPIMSYEDPGAIKRFSLEQNHHRLDHSLTVSLLAEAIGKESRLSSHEIAILRLAGAFHDVATPALGDTTKQLDPENLDEEKFWWEALGDEGQAFVRQFTNRETLDKVIKNEGVLGQILDIADRITYVMKDLHSVQTNLNPLSQNPLLKHINEIIIAHPKIGNIYQDVRVDKEKDKVFFENPDSIYAFLKIRALLHKELYLNPINQGRELLIAKLLEPLYDPINGPLTPTLLRKIDDNKLLEILQKTYPGSFTQYLTFDLVNWFPEFERFTTEEDAKLKEQKLRKQENIAVIGIKKIRGFSSGTSYNVSLNGQIIPFSEARPKETQELQEMEKSTSGIFLFWADVSQDSRMNPLLKAVLQKQIVDK